MRRLLNWILSPFSKDFNYFSALFILASATDMVAWCLYGDPIFAFYFGLHGFVMSYGLTLLVDILQNSFWQKICKIILIILGMINAAIDVFCHYSLKMGFTYDMVGIIKATNTQEVREFCDMFFDWRPLLIFLFIAIISCVVYKVKICRLHKLFQVLGCLLVLTGIVMTTIKESTNWGRVFIGKPFLYFSYELPPDLRQYYTDLKIEVDESRLPDNVVLVIGESFLKDHSSLYGYDKLTNPLLQKLQSDSLLFVFESVSSPATHTIPCFQNIMSTYDADSHKEWYQCTTLVEVIDKIGYQTTWLSNQSPKGGYDNVITRYAELCDTSFWVGNKFEGAKRSTFDEEVLSLFSSVPRNSSKKNFYCFHLMGNHYTFDTRYPLDEWSHFKETDYVEYMPHQRYNIATYDNSVLYNDYVVREIIKRFEEEDTLLLYLSDHALDIYNSSPDYVGHATGSVISKEVCSRIPYMIYLSPECKVLHPEVINIIEKSKMRPLNSTDLIYELMTLLGVKINL